jgi:hypothetical protein
MHKELTAKIRIWETNSGRTHRNLPGSMRVPWHPYPFDQFIFIIHHQLNLQSKISRIRWLKQLPCYIINNQFRNTPMSAPNTGLPVTGLQPKNMEILIPFAGNHTNKACRTKRKTSSFGILPSNLHSEFDHAQPIPLVRQNVPAANYFQIQSRPSLPLQE